MNSLIKDHFNFSTLCDAEDLSYLKEKPQIILTLRLIFGYNFTNDNFHW